MGPMTFALSACALFFILQSAVLAAPNSRCPPPEKVYSLTPSCRDDYDCKHGKICCLNQARALSCTEPGRWQTTDKYQGKYAASGIRMQGGPGIYCGHVKCMPFEKCVRDNNGKPVCRKA